MKNRRIILSILSALLIIILLIGSTGATIIIQSCNSCGISINTQIFTSSPASEDTCCGNLRTQCSPAKTDAIGNRCCTFTTEKLKITNYIPASLISFSVLADLIPSFTFPVVHLPEQIPSYPIFVHNKHGGRGVLTSNCQFLI